MDETGEGVSLTDSYESLGQARAVIDALYAKRLALYLDKPQNFQKWKLSHLMFPESHGKPPDPQRPTSIVREYHRFFGVEDKNWSSEESYFYQALRIPNQEIEIISDELMAFLNCQFELVYYFQSVAELADEGRQQGLGRERLCHG